METVDLAAGAPRGLCAALLGQEIAGVRLTGAPPDLCEGALGAVEAAAVTANIYPNATLHTVGPYLARNLSQLSDYFAGACTLDEVFATPGSDPRPFIREAARRALNLDMLAPLVEPGGRGYAEAVVRFHYAGAGNPLHNDMIARDARDSGLLVARSTDQLSVITCLQECCEGGELVHFRKRWRPEDERWKVAGRLGYDEAVVADAASVTFRPAARDIYLIDPRNYHKILPVEGTRTRITIGSFIVFFDDCPRRGWSMA